MGITKQYLGYGVVDKFNIISSGRCNLNFIIFKNIEGRFVASAAAEDVIIWDTRLDERVLTLKRDKVEVTTLRVSPDHLHIGVGYADGVVAIFDLANPESTLFTLALHKSELSILRYDKQGMRLLSGGLDCEIVVTDIIEQAGKIRLNGHTAPITDCHFLENFDGHNIVVSCSKDTQIKFWNLETQFCFKTIVDNRTEVWALAFIGNLLVAGCGESAMNVYRINMNQNFYESNFNQSSIQGLSINDEDTISPVLVTNCGAIQRAGKGRCASLIVDVSQKIISCVGSNNVVEMFYVCSEDETNRKLQKRLKKLKKKDCQSNECSQDSLVLQDKITRLESIKVKQKVKSVDVLLGAKNEMRIAIGGANNTIHIYSMSIIANGKLLNKDTNVKILRSVNRHGHQSEVRTVCFSSDSLVIGSGSAESFKFWNRNTLQCLRTVKTNYVLCSIFVPGDRYVILGLKSGKLLIVDVGSADIVEEIFAHENEIWSIDLLPDLKGCITGGNDCSVKIWTFQLIDADADNRSLEKLNEKNKAFTNSPTTPTEKVLSLLHKNTLDLGEEVLCIRVSSNMKYLVVGLLDSTIKIFFLDTFKFYLSLYGHKLPILCLDISYDSKLIATGSADRNVKIWGLDFGDCHVSLFAHDDSVLSLKFIPQTHFFLTCSKDGKIKLWDADTFNKILTLPGHIGQAYNLAVTVNGRYIVSCGSDRCLRLYERSDEAIVLEDVHEEEREELENQQISIIDSQKPLLPGLKLASRRTAGSEKAAESILECLEICKTFFGRDKETSELHPLMRTFDVSNPTDFIVVILNRIKLSDLEESLLVLPFSSVCELLQLLVNSLAQRPEEIESMTKVIVFLFKVHMKPLTMTSGVKSLLEKLINCLKQDLIILRDVVGLNLHSLVLIQKEIETRSNILLFQETKRK